MIARTKSTDELRAWLRDCYSDHENNRRYCIGRCPIGSSKECRRLFEDNAWNYSKIEKAASAFTISDDPDIQRKRESLLAYCYGHDCDGTCRFGHHPDCVSHTISTDRGDDPAIALPDRRIEHWYNIIFNHQPAPKETVDHPDHYQQPNGMECIDEMILVFGVESTMDFCLLNAWKYRYRAGAKNGDEDMRKANWYIAKYRELKEAKHE